MLSITNLIKFGILSCRTIQAVDDKKVSFELKPNDLVMSCSGTLGKVSIVPDGIQMELPIKLF